MKKKINYKESRGLPGGPNEQFTYVTGVFSTEGYKRNSPDVNNPFNIIPSGNITMKGVDFPVMGTDNLGNTQMMMPGNDYQFPGDQVLEIPVAQKGKEYNDATYAKARQEGRLYGLDPTTGDYYAPTLREAMIRPDIANRIYQGQNKFLSGALDVMSAPQKSMVELMTGKYQSPSEAMKITNPIASFLTDAVLDPTNLLGAGLVKRSISSVKPNLLRRGIGQWNVNNQLPPLPGSGNVTPVVNPAKNLEDLNAAQKFAQQYGYELPQNLERIAQSDELTNRTIRGMMDRHNTFVRGVSTNWDELGKRNPEILRHLEGKGFDLSTKEGTKAAAEYMATHIPISTGYGRASLNRDVFDQGLEGLYTSNSIPTAEGYTYGQGFITKVKRPTNYSFANRQDWITRNNPEYYEHSLPGGNSLIVDGKITQPINMELPYLYHVKAYDNVNVFKDTVLKDLEKKASDLKTQFERTATSNPEYSRNMRISYDKVIKQIEDIKAQKWETANVNFDKNLLKTEHQSRSFGVDFGGFGNTAEDVTIKLSSSAQDLVKHSENLMKLTKQVGAKNNKKIAELTEEYIDLLAKEENKLTSSEKIKLESLEKEIEYLKWDSKNDVKRLHTEYLDNNFPGWQNQKDKYAHYIHLGTPGEKVLQPIKSWEITPEIWKNKSRAHTNRYTTKLSAMSIGGMITPPAAIGTGYLGYEGLQEALQEKQYGGDNKGTRKLMRPGKNYQFPGDMVFEIPMAQVGQEVMINEGDGVRNIISTNSPQYRKAYKEGRLGVKYDDFIDMGDMREAVVTPYSPNLARDIMGVFDSGIKTAGELTGLAGTARFIDDPVENLKNAARFLGKTTVKGSPYTGSSVYGNVDLNTQVQYTPEELEGFFNTLDASGIAGAILAPAKAPLQAGLKQAAKYATTKTPLRNAWQYNPFAPKLGKYNRVVGQDAVEDMATSGLVRVNNHIIPYTPSIANSQDAFNYLDAFVRNKKLGTTRKQHLIDNIPLQDKIAMQNVEGDIIRRVNTLNGLEVVDNKLFKLNAGSNKKSLHFTHGAPVQSHLQGAWDAAPTTYIMPAKDFGSLNGMPRAVASGDTYWYNPRQFEFPKSLKVYTGDMEHAATLRNAGYDVTFDKESFKLNKKIKALQANPKAAQYGTPEYNELTSLSKQQAALHNAWVKAQNPKPIDVYDTKNIKLGTLEPDTYDSFDDLRSARNKTADAPYIHSETPEKKEWNNLILKDYKSKDADFILQQAKQNRNDYNAAIGTTSEEQWKKAIAPKTNKTLSHVDKMQLAREIMATDIKDLLKLKQAIEINPYTNISDNFRLDLINNRLQTGTNLYRYQTGGEYKVKAGDTFYGIANRNNISWEDLKKANPDINIENLKINQVIKLPRLNTPKIEIPSWASLENISPVSFQDNTFAVKPFVNNVPMFQTETKPEEKPEEKQEPSRYEKLKEQYLKDLKIQENSVKKGWNEEKQLWFPYKAVEKDGGYDIGFGHKILRGEDFSKGLTQEEVIALMLKDYKNKRKSAESFYNRKGFDRKWEDLDPTEQILLTDYQYNAGLNKFPKFLKAVANKDKNTMLKEYIRYSDGKPLVERNKWTKSFIENTLNYQKGGDVPIYVTDINDPRLKNYNDSLNLHNNYLKAKKLLTSTNRQNYNEFFNLREKIEKLTPSSSLIPNGLYEGEKNYGTLETYYPKNKTGEPRFETVLYNYEKPKQPVKYRNPEIAAKQQLIDAGYDIGGADGIWGKKSQAAPIYVDNPNDPRLKAYKDSLALYNSPYSEKLKNVNPNNVDYEKGEFFNSEFGKDNIKPIAITKSDARPIYKKPVQPYVYRNPEIIAKQQELIKAGYDIGGADGIWGPKSQAAWDEYTKQKEVKQPQIVENKPPIQTIIPRQKPQREYDNSNKPFVFLLGNAAYATYDDATAKDFARDLGIENPQRGNNKNIDPNTGLYREYNKTTPNKYSQKLKPLENGGELNVYEDYINGMYDGTSKEAQAQKIYDKLNRVYYRNAKELGMTPPNYIMSKVIRS